ncbi:MAG TPA: murein biosynthesis integral membrane protein MurJ [Tepidimicrobium sp.]|nr:murein biosynthesis integral membrane protein MurJ [Tepidimicrobium sp.]
MSNRRKATQSVAMISTFTLISKFLGFIREVLTATKYGSGYETDTYFVAMTATVILMTTIGAALNTTLIPIFTEIGERRGRVGKLRFLNTILNMVFLVTLILAILGFFLSPLTIKILAKGFTGDQLDLAIRLNRIGLPIVIFLGFTYVFSGYLHSGQIFGPPAIMGLPYNAIFILFLVIWGGKENVEYLMLASVAAAATQFLIQVPAIRHQGYRYSFNVDLQDPYLNQVFRLVIPVMIGSAVQQINTIVDRTLASSLATGSISALTYASRMNDLIISVFVMAITTVVFPVLSKAFAQGDRDKVKGIMAKGINIILFITVPATIGIIILAEPIVRLFFQRGAFDRLATSMTASALIFYSIGLIGSSLRLMLNRVYYSFQDTKTPMMNGGLAVGLNIILNLILMKPMGHSGLALATSISATFTTILLFTGLRKRLGSIGLISYIGSFTKTLFASIIMGALVYVIFYGLTPKLPDYRIVEPIMLFFSIGIGALSYFILCFALKVNR